MTSKTRVLLSVSVAAAVLAVVLPVCLSGGGSSRQTLSVLVEGSPPPVARQAPKVVVPVRVAVKRSVRRSPPPVVVVVVRAGDTLSSIGLRVGRSWLQLDGWNRLTDPNVIEVGEVLRVPPAGYRPPPILWPARPVPVQPSYAPPPVAAAAPPPSGGVFSFPMLEGLWVQAGGPSWAAGSAASIALCESGGEPWARNPSGASGLWQILGQVVPGDLFDPLVNAENAVSKFHGSGDTFAQWVCRG